MARRKSADVPPSTLVVFAGLAAFDDPFLGWALWRNPRRAFLDCVANVGRSVELVVEVLVDRIRFRAQRHRLVAEQQPFTAIFIDEMLVDRLGAEGAPRWIDEDVVPTGCTNDVGHDVFGHQTLSIGTDASSENHQAILDVHCEVVDVEAIVRFEPLAHQTAKLVVAQIVEAMEIFKIARHGTPGLQVRPSAPLSATRAQNRYDSPRVSAGLFVQNDRACVGPTTAVPPVGAV